MKILFLTGEIQNQLNANTKIAFNMAKKIADKGNECFVAGVCKENISINDESVNIIALKSPKAVEKANTAFENFISRKGVNRSKVRKQFMLKHPFKSGVLFLSYTKFYLDFIQKPLYLKQVKKLIKDIDCDCVIAVYKPVGYYEIFMNSGINIKKYPYQLDPWGLHETDNADFQKEINTFEKAEGIFTTPVLLESYKNHPQYSKFAYKMYPLEFPNIKKPYISEKSVIDFDENYANILFCGIVADEYRNPKEVLKYICSLIDSGKKIRVYFLGTDDSAVLNEYIKKYPRNVFFHDKVSVEKAFATMDKADILLNISNTLSNQVPSKIFDYFSMGKPILNLQQTDSCPAQRYFDKYPLSFTVKSGEKTDLSRLAEFIFGAKNKRIDFEKTEKIYFEATEDYAADKILSVIKKER